MPKIIIWDKSNFVIADLEGKTETSGPFKIAKFKNYRIMKRQTIKKQLKKIEAVIKYSNTKGEENESR